jgi:hypothetical protein
LSVPIHCVPGSSEEVEALAREIAGASATAEIQDLARAIAEAQIDLRRVRHARHQMLSRALSNPHASRANVREKARVIGRPLFLNAPEVPLDRVIRFITSTPEGPERFGTILLQQGRQLLAMDRYERRALSRRKFAIRGLEEAQRKFRLGRVVK